MSGLFGVVQCPIGNTWELYSRRGESKLSIRTVRMGDKKKERKTNEKTHAFHPYTIIFKSHFP